MRLRLLGIIGLALLASVEVGARAVLGLGTPPLSIAHPTIEYMFAPNQDVVRFGNRILINEAGMRSEPVSRWGDKERVLVLGDSVVNGGALTDHEALATTILTDDTTVYGNVSAGSWGPANILAWHNEYGSMNASAAVLVLSSHDLTDLPTFEPLNANSHPTANPPLAIIEGVQRYLPRYLPTQGSEHDRERQTQLQLERLDDGLIAINALIDFYSENNLPLCAVLHPTITEIESGDQWQRPILDDAFEGRGVPSLRLELLLNNPAEDVDKAYRDNIHLSETGQTVLVDAITSCAGRATIPD